jgi:hypothetical protein
MKNGNSAPRAGRHSATDNVRISPAECPMLTHDNRLIHAGASLLGLPDILVREPAEFIPRDIF